MSVESGPSGMGSNGATQTVEQTSAPSTSMGKSFGGARFGEPISHTTPLSGDKSAFSKDTHQSFRAADFKTIATPRSEKHTSAKSVQHERQTLEQVFKTSAPLHVSRIGHSADTSQPFHAQEFRTVWPAPHSEKQNVYHGDHSVAHPRAEDAQHIAEPQTTPRPSSHEQTQPLHHETVIWQTKPTEKTDIQHNTLSRSAVNEYSVPPIVQSKETSNTQRNKVSSKPIKVARHTETKTHPQENTAAAKDTVKSSFLEHHEVQHTLHTTKPQEQQQIASAQPTYRGAKVELDTKTTEFLKMYKLSEQQTKQLPQEILKPEVATERVTSSQVHAALKPEVTSHPKATEQEIEAVAQTMTQATEVLKLMEQTGTQKEIAQKKVLEIVQKVVKKQKLETAVQEVIQDRLPDENPPELPLMYFNRDELTDAVRENLTMRAAIDTYAETGTIDGEEVAARLPNPDAQPEQVKSTLVKGTDNLQDGSYQEFIDDIKTTDATTLHDMQAKVDYIIDHKPAVNKPSEELRDPVEEEDVDRVLNELEYMPVAA